VPSMELEKYLEILLFNVVGALTGLLAERANRQRDLYRETAEELEVAYRELQKGSEDLLRLEKKMRHSEKISALGELSATVAHEFMNPLGSIKGAVEILRDDFPEGHDKHAFLKILIKEIDRLERTVRSVLRFGRQERLEKTRCSPVELMESILILTRGEAAQRGIEVRQDLSGTGRQMALDADKIQQVFLNLVMNAVQAMPEGGLLSVGSGFSETPPSEMKQDGAEEGPGFLLTVEDTGVGIPEEEIGRIFESFYTTREEGTGLGLAIVKTILRAHGGSIRLRSAPGEGTRVRVWLPEPRN
jgi:two-component system sensor histidine kinase HydH